MVNLKWHREWNLCNFLKSRRREGGGGDRATFVFPHIFAVLFVNSFSAGCFQHVTKRKRFSKVYCSWIQFSLHLSEVLKWFMNHCIRYLLTFPTISVSDFKIAYKRRYPNLIFNHVFLFELANYIFKIHPQISLKFEGIQSRHIRMKSRSYIDDYLAEKFINFGQVEAYFQMFT